MCALKEGLGDLDRMTYCPLHKHNIVILRGLLLSKCMFYDFPLFVCRVDIDMEHFPFQLNKTIHI